MILRAGSRVLNKGMEEILLVKVLTTLVIGYIIINKFIEDE